MTKDAGQLTDIEKRINEAKSKNTTSFSLEFKKLSTIPECIGQLTNLTSP